MERVCLQRDMGFLVGGKLKCYKIRLWRGYTIVYKKPFNLHFKWVSIKLFKKLIRDMKYIIKT